jgi:hypothetical protein
MRKDPLNCRRWRHAISPAVVQEGPGYLCETCHESGATTNRQFRKLFGRNFYGTNEKEPWTIANAAIAGAVVLLLGGLGLIVLLV